MLLLNSVTSPRPTPRKKRSEPTIGVHFLLTIVPIVIMSACGDAAIVIAEALPQPRTGPPSSGSGESELPDNWRCLTEQQTRPVDAGQFTFRFPIVNWEDESPVPGLVINTCSKTDTVCVEPLSSPIISPDTNQSDRFVSMNLESDFGRFNFIELMSTDGVVVDPTSQEVDVTNAFVPVSYYLGDTTHASRTIAPLIRLTRAPLHRGLFEALGVTLSETKGFTTARVFDCNGNTAPGVRFEISPTYTEEPPTPFTYVDGLLQRTFDSDEYLVTDADGEAGFANVPAGNIRVLAFLDSHGDLPIGPPGGIAATARPGQVTVVELHAKEYGYLPAATE